MADLPAVSVVIPVYNAEEFIGTTLESVFSQTFSDYEVIAADDGSTDRSVSIIQEAAKRHGKDVTILHQNREKSPAARNLGASHARGRYLAFLDADDLWHPDNLRRQVSLLESEPETVMVWCDWDVINDQEQVIRRGLDKHAMHCPDASPLTQLLGADVRSLHLSGVLIRRDDFFRSGGFDTKTFPVEDYDFAFRMKQYGRVRFHEDVLLTYRHHGKGISKNSILQLEGHWTLLQKLESHYRGDARKIRLVHRLMADVRSNQGWNEIKDGRSKDGRRLIREAIEYNPAKFRTYSRLVRSYIPWS